MMYSLTHSLTHSFNRSPIHLLTQACSDSDQIGSGACDENIYTIVFIVVICALSIICCGTRLSLIYLLACSHMDLLRHVFL